ncbi:ATP12 family chaperone protein [Xanthobacter variabilis]|uniref:ATP12 family chaperone protein n=1 Tax=Xanthobacter variabilis TaxID=3119932 RepID=UPI00374F7010
MRDLLTDLDGTNTGPDANPMARAQAAQRPQLPKRFYKDVSVGEVEGGFTVLLDGRPVRTPARGLLLVPTRALAEALAREWEAQEAEINPFSMPLTRLVNVALDRVAAEPAAVRDEVVRYAGTDMLFYRADGPTALLERQAQHWDPVLAWAREERGAPFFLAEGVRHVAQPEESLARMSELVPGDALPLAAVHVMTTLTGSALLALAVSEGVLDADAAWQAAHVDEDWNRELWGEDELATARRDARRVDMDAAVALLRLHSDRG